MNARSLEVETVPARRRWMVGSLLLISIAAASGLKLVAPSHAGLASADAATGRETAVEEPAAAGVDASLERLIELHRNATGLPGFGSGCCPSPESQPLASAAQRQPGVLPPRLGEEASFEVRGLLDRPYGKYLTERA